MKPLFSEFGVIGFVPDDWEDPWMPRQQVLTRLGKYFQVIWMNPPKYWRDSFNLKGLFSNARFLTNNDFQGFTIYKPSPLLPKIYNPKFLSTFTENQRLKTVQKFIGKRKIKKTILYIWRPEFYSIMKKVNHNYSCYHIDDEYSFSEKDKPISENEKYLLSTVDQVIIHSPALMEKKGKVNSNTIYITNGVDYINFSLLRNEPEDLKLIPHPRIGYVGIIKKQLNFQNLLTLSHRHPEWNFIFVGPKNVTVDELLFDQLSKQENVYFLGGKPVQDLPQYVQHMDVGLLPYVLNDYTKYIYPLKIHEYLASGLPTVGSPIRSLQEFSNIIYLATSIEDWEKSIQQALLPSEKSQEKINTRRNTARKFDWDYLVYKIARSFCELLGENYTEILDEFHKNTLNHSLK